MRDNGLQAGFLLRAAEYDRRGKLLVEKVQAGHSFVIAFPTGINWDLSNQSITAPALTDTTGNSRTLSTTTTANEWATHAAAADTTLGIVVGTGTNAVAMADTALQTQIAEGSSSGQLNHGAQSYGSAVMTTGTGSRYINIVRTFQNNSSGTISMTEAALYGTLMCTGATLRKFCFARDLLNASVTSGNLLVVQYQLIWALT